MPEGKLEFLGRRDTQVKISGFRIEIGEIENALLSVPGVRDGAVVVAERADQSKHLVAFYSSRQPLGVDLLRDRLGQSLPEYMVPAVFHWRESLPLTANSKIDRKKLTALAAELAVVARNHDAPCTPTEERLAAAWSTGARHPPRPDRPAGPLLRPGWHVPVGGEAGAHFGPCGVAQGRHPQPRPGRPGRRCSTETQRRSGMLQLLSESDGRTGARPRVLSLRRRQCRQLPASGQRTPRKRGDGLRRGATGTRPGRRERAVRCYCHRSSIRSSTRSQRGLTRVMLWGHSSGTAGAMETARKLQARGVDVQHVFLGAQLLGDSADRRTAIAELTGRSNAEIAARLSSETGYTELGELDAQRAEHVGAAYRHDCVSAHRYFADALDAPPAAKLSAPVTVVVAADDPSTAAYLQRYRDWQLLADHVDLHELADGGHYFLRTRPAEAALAVLRSAELLASS